MREWTVNGPCQSYAVLLSVTRIRKEMGHVLFDNKVIVGHGIQRAVIPVFPPLLDRSSNLWSVPSSVHPRYCGKGDSAETSSPDPEAQLVGDVLIGNPKRYFACAQSARFEFPFIHCLFVDGNTIRLLGRMVVLGIDFGFDKMAWGLGQVNHRDSALTADVRINPDRSSEKQDKHPGPPYCYTKFPVSILWHPLLFLPGEKSTS